jgi:hypothetical protein
MLKSILKLEGAQKLTKNEQKSINGGIQCAPYPQCNGNEVSFYKRNACGWYLYWTTTGSICMEYMP